MKRDLYAEVSTRIVAELERGAAPWIKPWSATAGMNTPCNAATNRPYSGSNVVLLWMTANAGDRTPRYLTFKQALDLGGNVRKGEHGTKVYFVKQLQVADRNGAEGETRIVPMMREYTVFNVDQCEGLPDRVLTLGEVKVRNIDERDATSSTSAMRPIGIEAGASLSASARGIFMSRAMASTKPAQRSVRTGPVQA